MADDITIKNTGLRGIKVADTKVSFIDGEKGVLIYRGYRIEDLAENSTFEETVYLILKGVVPSSSELSSFKNVFAASSRLPEHVIESMKLWPGNTEPMQVLMAVISILGFDAVSYSDDLSHAENILFMIKGERPDHEISRALDICLILHADHTFNASTFACREVASTQAGIYPAVLAGLAALSGPLHGGANEKAMAMIEDLRNEDDIESWIQKQLSEKKKIYGMGHAVYKTYDPRAAILKNIFKKLGTRMKDSSWYTLCETVENAAINVFTSAGKDQIKPNIDFYSGSVYHAMGFPHDLFTPLFAVSRISGWCAHIIEERFGLAQSKPSLYRPAAEYIGNYCGLMGCDYRKKEK
jgi:citrate synthase